MASHRDQLPPSQSPTNQPAPARSEPSAPRAGGPAEDTLEPGESLSRVEAWEAVSEEAKGHFRVFSVREIQYRSPVTRNTHGFYVIDASDWVNVIPITPEGEVILVRQYRHGVKQISLEVPGGIIDPGERPDEAAARELLEETGYAAEELISLGPIAPNPAIQSNFCHTYLAKNARYVATPTPDATEEIDVVKVRREDLPRLVADGSINHALVVVGLYWLELYERGLIPGRG